MDLYRSLSIIKGAVGGEGERSALVVNKFNSGNLQALAAQVVEPGPE